jgi:hypothetical protein
MFLKAHLRTVLATQIAALFVGLLAGPVARAGLDQSGTDGYRLWLHSLERTVAGRQAAEEPERNLLFPFDTPAWQTDAGSAPAFRHLAISKAVAELEKVWQDRDGAGGPPPLVALANARNYMHLSEYDSALVWFAVAARRDTSGQLREEISRETLAAATAARDSLATVRALTNTLGLSSLEDRDGEIVLAYRWLLTTRDARSVDHLIEKVAGRDSVLSGRVRYWHAYALAWRGRHASALDQLTRLVGDGGLSHDLSETERTWVLCAIPDLMYLTDDAQGADWLYRLLAASTLPRLQMWGIYQSAGLDMADARYAEAAVGYKSVCEGPRFGAWQDQACTLGEIAERLEGIRAEGEKYGTAAFYGR